MKTTVYIATSLDGFIARKNGDVDWLPQFGATGEDYGFHTFMDTVDALVMGRNTFEKVLSFGVEWPYGEKPVFVLSSRTLKIPGDLPDTVEHLPGSMTEIVQTLIQRGVEHAYIDGGSTTQRFLQAGLVDRFIVTVIPVLIGGGIPLFGSVAEDVRLKLIDTRNWPSGLVQYTYDVVPPE